MCLKTLTFIATPIRYAFFTGLPQKLGFSHKGSTGIKSLRPLLLTMESKVEYYL